MPKRKILYVVCLSVAFTINPIFANGLSLEQAQKKAIDNTDTLQIDHGLEQVERNYNDGIKKAIEAAEKQQEEFDMYKMYFSPDKPTLYRAVIYSRDILPYQTELQMENLKLQKSQIPLQLNISVANLYKEILYLNDAYNIQKLNLKLAEKNLEQKEKLFTLGNISEIEIQKLRNDVKVKKLELDKFKIQKDNVEVQLKNLLKIDLDEELELDENFIIPKRLKTADEYIKSALGNRIDLKLKINEFKSVEKEYTLYKEYNPEKLQYQIDDERKKAKELLDRKEIEYNFMIEKDIKKAREAEVSNRASKEADEAKKRALENNYLDKKAQLNTKIDQIKAEILSGYETVIDTKAKVEDAKEKVEYQQNKALENKALFDKGMMTKLNYDMSLLALENAKLELRKQQREYTFLLYKLDRASVKGPAYQ